ncbi:Golgi apyrase [Quaeritorhiza haematococci]|nr:Golgi apyrase [Quaeritorhiza haematococci]
MLIACFLIGYFLFQLFPTSSSHNLTVPSDFDDYPGPPLKNSNVDRPDTFAGDGSPSTNNNHISSSSPSVSVADTHIPDASTTPLTADGRDPDAAVLNLDSGFKPHHFLASDADEEEHDSWTRHREYGVVIDAGSSGSRVLVYSWKNPLYLRREAQTEGRNAKDILDGLPVIEKGVESGDHWQFKVEPGISTYAEKPEDVGAHLRPLLDYAVRVVPARKLATTPVYLLATAGMRLVSDSARTAILENTCTFIKMNYVFATDGGCHRHFRVISGELEGIYGWMAVNYLMGGFEHRTSTNPATNKMHTFGFLDMGGASTQIAFEPTAEMSLKHNDDLTKVTLRTISGDDTQYRIFVTTFLGFGMNEARRRYIESLIEGTSPEMTESTHVNESPSVASSRRTLLEMRSLRDEDMEPSGRFGSAEPIVAATAGADQLSKDHSRDEKSSVSTSPESSEGTSIKHGNSGGADHSTTTSSTGTGSSSNTHYSSTNDDAPSTPTTSLEDPCLPIGLSLVDAAHSPHNLQTSAPRLIGTGSLDTCLRNQIPLLNKSVPCSEEPCLFNGVHAPLSPSDFPKHRFLGVSEYWYTSSEIYNMGGPYDYARFRKAAESFCKMGWNEIMRNYERGRWPTVNGMERLQLQCFKSAWIMNVLHEGFGIPRSRSSEKSGSSAETGTERVVHEGVDDALSSTAASAATAALNANRFSATFQSVNEIGDFTVSWTLGAILLHAAATVPKRGIKTALDYANDGSISGGRGGFTTSVPAPEVGGMGTENMTGTRIQYGWMPWFATMLLVAALAAILLVITCKNLSTENNAGGGYLYDSLNGPGRRGGGGFSNLFARYFRGLASSRRKRMSKSATWSRDISGYGNDETGGLLSISVVGENGVSNSVNSLNGVGVNGNGNGIVPSSTIVAGADLSSINVGVRNAASGVTLSGLSTTPILRNSSEAVAMYPLKPLGAYHREDLGRASGTIFGGVGPPTMSKSPSVSSMGMGMPGQGVEMDATSSSTTGIGLGVGWASASGRNSQSFLRSSRDLSGSHEWYADSRY